MRKNVVLIGFMGSGKSSVGKQLAQKLSYRFLDTDQMIEQRQGKRIAQIMKEEGEPAFRRMETALLSELLTFPEYSVIATGGGLPMTESNAPLLKEAGFVVYLRTKPETVLSRLASDNQRPLLAVPNREERVHSLMAYRSPVYEYACHMAVDTDEKGLLGVTEEIIRNYNYFRKKR